MRKSKMILIIVMITVTVTIRKIILISITMQMIITVITLKMVMLFIIDNIISTDYKTVIITIITNEGEESEQVSIRKLNPHTKYDVDCNLILQQHLHNSCLLCFVVNSFSNELPFSLSFCFSFYPLLSRLIKIWYVLFVNEIICLLVYHCCLDGGNCKTSIRNKK